MTNAKRMPREEGIDHSISLLREGYMYILNRRRSFQSDLFETRLLGKKAICMGGKEAAELFYDENKFKRQGVLPKRVEQTLVGKGGVQSLDGAAHKDRKAMFMSIMSPDNIKRLIGITKRQWETAIRKWEQQDEVVLYEEAQEILCRTACEWAGVSVADEDIKTLTEDLASMFESPAVMGPAHWKGRHARNRAETWLVERIEAIREGKLEVPEHMALGRFSLHRDHEGNLLAAKVAAVEVLNILRPIVAISIYISFTALAIHHYPEERKKLAAGDEKYAQMFVQEVRRFYPFFPLQGAEVIEDFTWNGFTFEKGVFTVLDLYGTNHDPKIWDNPDVFRPERFVDWEGSPFDFIPQGGGDHYLGHRCAGEWVTIEIMKASLDFLANRLEYEVPEQDLSYSMVKMPSMPHSKVRIRKVRRNQ